MKIEISLLEGIEQAEIVVPLYNEEIDKWLPESKSCQRAYSNFWERLITNIPKAIEFDK